MSQSLFPPEKWSSDAAYITARTMKTSFAIGAVLGAPLYVALSLSKRRKISIGRFLDISTLSGIGAAGAGGLAEYSRSALSDPATLKNRRLEKAYSKDLRRQDDFGAIGAILGVVLVPAVFWTRAGLLDLTIGGGVLGYSSGFVTHHVQRLLGNPADKVPEPEIPADDPRMRRR